MESMTKAYLVHNVEAKPKTEEEVFKELEAAAKKNILVSVHIAMIKSGQMEFLQGLVSLVHSLTEYGEVLEDRVNLLLTEPAANA